MASPLLNIAYPSGSTNGSLAGMGLAPGRGGRRCRRTEPLYSHLRTPRAAAVAGIVFSVLLVIIFWVFRSAVPADPMDPGTWLTDGSRSVTLALNLIPFAGIAFLWFIGVLRDRLGPREDRFFATAFLGSGLVRAWRRDFASAAAQWRAGRAH